MSPSLPSIHRNKGVFIGLSWDRVSFLFPTTDHVVASAGLHFLHNIHKLLKLRQVCRSFLCQIFFSWKQRANFSVFFQVIKCSQCAWSHFTKKMQRDAENTGGNTRSFQFDTPWCFCIFSPAQYLPEAQQTLPLEECSIAWQPVNSFQLKLVSLLCNIETVLMAVFKCHLSWLLPQIVVAHLPGTTVFHHVASCWNAKLERGM